MFCACHYNLVYLSVEYLNIAHKAETKSIFDSATFANESANVSGQSVMCDWLMRGLMRRMAKTPRSLEAFLNNLSVNVIPRVSLFHTPWHERGAGRRETLGTRLLFGDFCVYLFYYFLTGSNKRLSSPLDS